MNRVASRTLWVAVISALWWAGYSLLNHWNSSVERAVFLSPRPVDVLPWIYQPLTSIPYVFFIAILIGWAVISISDAALFGHLLRAVVLGTLVGFGFFAIWPLNIVRPESQGNGVGDSVLRYVISVDEPANCFPSFHSFFAVLCAIFIGKANRSKSASALAWFLAAVVLVTTITTGQHYLCDVFGGVTLAIVAYLTSNLKRIGAWYSS